MKEDNQPKKFEKEEISLDLSNFYDDEKDIFQDYEYVKSLINLRDFQCIFSHHIIIEREITFFLANDFPISHPYYDKLDFEKIKQFKNQINNCQSFPYEKLNLNDTIINELNSLINNSQSIKIKIKEKKNESLVDSKVLYKKSNSFEIKKSNKGFMNDIKINSNYSEMNPKIKKIKNNAKKRDQNSKIKNNKSSQDSSSKIFSNTNSKNIDDTKSDLNKKDNIIYDEKDFRAIKNIDNIPFNYYAPDVNVIGKVYEGEIINNIYDIFNAITMRKSLILKNQHYKTNIKGKQVEAEFDFQIINLNLKDFLYFIGLIFPNIGSLDYLEEPLKSEINAIFTNGDPFENIKNLKINDDLKKYEYIDVIGEITLDLFNIQYKKNLQIKKYITLSKKMENNKDLNELFHFCEKNKKIIIVITNGLFEEFYKKMIKKDNSINDIKKYKKKNKYTDKVKDKDTDTDKVKDKDKDKDKDKYESINHIFIYIRSNKEKNEMIEKKLKFEYINMLEDALKLKEGEKDKENNNPEKNQKIKKFQSFKFSELYNTFYKHILINNKIQCLRKGLSYMNKKFINAIGSKYFAFLNKNININKIKEIFLKNINLKIKYNTEYIRKIKEEFEKNKKDYIPSIAIFEITSKDSMFKDKEKMRITNYRGIAYDQNGDKVNIDKIEREFNSWLIENEYCIKIVIYNTDSSDKNILLILYILQNCLPQDFFLIINEQIEKHITFKIEYYSFKYNRNSSININKIIEKGKYIQFLVAKMNFQFNFFDKILKKRLIVQNNNELESKNYLNYFLIKINQDISIYSSIDITNFNDTFFNVESIKNQINNLNQFDGQFISEEKNNILNKFNNNECLNDLLIANINIEESLDMKFKNYKENLNLIYYKFIEVYYEKIIKRIIKKIIIREYAAQK